ncbi:ornithine aminomutase subunit alpha [Clostridium formicaceticum]|uniref:D-ornithine 4,5-aminomutase subunit alpha n=1 Tax=Clostridium formicaceticum TaxID=1497 RepID=A0AAC9WG23_9CLOT|nr:ornithine aminomutase subunit alpha [Clostridium formicaceticum]AOY76964.1 ornithine aminomutase [Clostridium formicaceticum]ARE87448.1 D-ornithine 4,5-aminomutase subunit alpha [Clostridium formicaceticum]
MKRADDFQQRRQHLKDLSDEALEKRFWELAEKIVDPMIALARKHTTPSIERSVLLRMGFSSIEAKAIVEAVMDRGLMGKGAGHVVYRLAKEKDLSIREAGLQLMERKLWDEVVGMFKGGAE